MISGNLPAPSSSAIGDAITLLKVLEDPAAAQAMLANLQEAASFNAKQLAIIMTRLKEVEAREAAVSSQETAADARIAQLLANEKDLVGRIQENEQIKAKLVDISVALDAREITLQQATQDLSAASAAQEADYQGRIAALDNRDSQLILLYADKAAALDAREVALVEREAALEQAQKDLEERQAKLRVLLG